MGNKHFDVIVVGAGHAGVEASLAAARLGLQVLVVTTNLDRIGFMSCNPSIGGLAKGHMVKEVDCLGGAMGLIADRVTIQYKKLNARKGPAVRGTRVQCDKDLYCQEIGKYLEEQPNISIQMGEVESLLLEKQVCRGVILKDGSTIKSHTVVITTGTFLRGVMHIGLQKIEGGRVGDQASIGLSDQLSEHGFKVFRLKTGTPPRLLASSIDWSKTIAQGGDEKYQPFSYRSRKQLTLAQINCYITHTNEETHEIIRKNLHVSAMYSGQISGFGPRYCPSIEDKITRFAERANHQTFLEPEGLSTESVYLQGISTSLPADVQEQFLKTIVGLEQVKMIRPGYAVEYDFVEPTQLHPSLETKNIENLFLAGQINGTSGYEEAAGQGLIAGINAGLKVKNQGLFTLGREEAYIGVLIDDLVTKGTKEPYRMFTSRAEHRLVLREDNTIERLTEKAIAVGLLSDEQKANALKILAERESLERKISDFKIGPTAENLAKLNKLGTPPIQKQVSLADILRRSEIKIEQLNEFIEVDGKSDDIISEPVEIRVKYSGYIKRQNEIIGQIQRLEDMKISPDLNYSAIRGLSNEEIEKLNSIKPRTIAQAQRISGVNPSAIQSIMYYLKRNTVDASKRQ